MGETGGSRRRRRRRSLLVFVLVVAVIIIGGVIAFRPIDNAVRGYVEKQIAVSVRSSLRLPEDTRLDVTVGGKRSMLRQLLSGKIARVDITADRVTFGEFTGPAQLVATGVPIDLSKPVGTLGITFSIPQEQLLTVSKNLSGVPLTAVTVDDSRITASADLSALFVTIPVSVGLLPAAVDGQIAFTPNSISVAGADFTANALRQRFGAIATQALTTQNLCIAAGLPKQFVLDDVNPEPGELVLHFAADGALLTPEALAPLGSCPGG